jgi:hypothetical protein
VEGCPKGGAVKTETSDIQSLRNSIAIEMQPPPAPSTGEELIGKLGLYKMFVRAFVGGSKSHPTHHSPIHYIYTQHCKLPHKPTINNLLIKQRKTQINQL